MGDHRGSPGAVYSFWFLFLLLFSSLVRPHAPIHTLQYIRLACDGVCARRYLDAMCSALALCAVRACHGVPHHLALLHIVGCRMRPRGRSPVVRRQPWTPMRACCFVLCTVCGCKRGCCLEVTVNCVLCMCGCMNVVARAWMYGCRRPS